MSELTIGRYEIRDELGEGGMGTVYRAYDPTLGREVALKVLQPQLYREDPQFSMRFEREARTIASLEHSSIVSLYEFGEDSEWLYIVMRLMEGGTLRERLERGPLGLEETIAIVRRIGGALDKAHSRGIVHRDLKPGNILFDEDGEAFLSDFGIVKAEDSTGLKTRTGMALGTPHYMSPEQLDGKEVDGRSDIYSLGVVLFEMLSGERPYDHESLVRLAMMHLTSPVPNIVEANPGLPPDLETVINKAMAKEPAERYGTAGEMVEALKGVAVKKAAPRATVIAAVQIEPVAEAEPAVTISEEPSPPVVTVAEPEATISEKPSPPVAADAKKGGLPGWIWWVGAVVVVLLLVFGIRAMFGGGGDETLQPTEESGGAIVDVVSTITPGPVDMLEPTEQSEGTIVEVIPTAAATATSMPPTSTATTTPEPADTPTVTPSPTASPTPNVPPPDAELGSLWERSKDQMKMVYVPPGTFPMGSNDLWVDEKPVHDVTLDGFWIDTTEVTNAHYAQCVGADVCEASFYVDDSTYNGDGYPVVGVSWDDADTYCSWAGGQLPAEAQWEYAARGADGNRYPWGEKEPTCELAQLLDCAGQTVPAGSYPEGASWVGALDMAGNVWEWVNDWYNSDYYANSPTENPAGPESGSSKVQRGGGWNHGPADLRGPNRDGDDPFYGYDDIGFRCVWPGG